MEQFLIHSYVEIGLKNQEESKFHRMKGKLEKGALFPFLEKAGRESKPKSHYC